MPSARSTGWLEDYQPISAELSKPSGARPRLAAICNSVLMERWKVPRSRQRICLQQQALKLDLNWLARRRLIAPGLATGPNSIRWVNSDGEGIASGWVSADMEGDTEGSLGIRIGEFEQRIPLVTLPRHYGGRQWFFRVPGNEPSRIGPMAASRCAAVRQQARLAREGRIQLAIHDADGSRPSRQGKD